jgi:hypothetical protein
VARVVNVSWPVSRAGDGNIPTPLTLATWQCRWTARNGVEQRESGVLLYEFLNSASDGDERPKLPGRFVRGKLPHVHRIAGRISLLTPKEVCYFSAHLLEIRELKRGI